MIIILYKNTIFRLRIKINDLTINHNHICIKKTKNQNTRTHISSSAIQKSVLQSNDFQNSHIIRLKVKLFVSSLELARFLQEFLLLQSEGHAHRHLGDEPLAGRLRHLLTESEVDLTDASTALEKIQGMVCDTVTH